MSRDNFSPATKRRLAERAGFLCSYPGCPAVTIGPSDESESSTANTGEAAHISAAAAGPGARRYDSNIEPKARSSIENGIWCCRTHAKLIDTDDQTYSVEMLKQWRILAEQRAQMRQAYGKDFEEHRESLVKLGLAKDIIEVKQNININHKIGVAVELSWLSEIFGKPAAHSIRDFLIEHSRNALSHGGATFINIEFQANSINVIDDGANFPICQLLSLNHRGGGMALKALRNIKSFGHISSQRINDSLNSIHIPLVLNASELPAVNPCAIKLEQEMIWNENIDFTGLIACDRAFIIAPNFASFSEGPLYERLLKDLIDQHSNVVLIFPEVSEGVLSHFRKLFPSVEVETW